MCRLLLLAVLITPAVSARDAKKEDKVDEAAELEKAIFEATNKEREKEKLPPLKSNATLTKVARGHSVNMGKQGKLEHVLDDKKPSDRVRDAGYVFSNVGENILGHSEKLSAAKAVEIWMNSKPHRENILRMEYTEIGVGVARTEKGEWYYTQVFGRPRR